MNQSSPAKASAPSASADLADELITMRDILRHAVSRFRAADLVHAHGATTALDEAAYLILETLHLPVDQLEPFVDARLTRTERQTLLDLIEKRIATRKPAAYLTGRTYIQGIPFKVDERVIVPRSYIGEMLFSGLFGGDDFTLIDDVQAVTSVLDLCTGSGCLAILAAHIFPHARIDAVELSPDAMAVARENVAESGFADRINLFQGDLFAPLKGKTYDLIITNPPYVDAETMADLPPEFRAEPAMALAGGADGMDVVRRILAEAGKHLKRGGGMICEIGTDREILDADYPAIDFLWLDSAESSGEVFWVTESQLRKV
ncbi:MAG: 50S ribosomal protein L3 N(5)-glutamine methyltransferase [Beijerinckiaceae bacterium]|jgi:ribosomal protein L3 glutamine methyltransferase|nr:50S ribosomal protein L3 N(5)-glutamine methyltransferase [Beijerinckiaceae bacterium]